VERSGPDVLITDVRMPPTGRDEGIRAARTLRRTHPAVGVLVLSNYADPGYVTALFEAGAHARGYLLKQHLTAPRQLQDAVRAVAGGGAYVDPEVARVWAAGVARQRTSGVAQLTPRERDVLAAMATGRNNAGIAAALMISERAVEKRVNSIFAKLGVSHGPQVLGRVRAVLTFLEDGRTESPG
jgi:DNA-binding NarL/FixJ family response regulator